MGERVGLPARSLGLLNRLSTTASLGLKPSFARVGKGITALDFDSNGLGAVMYRGDRHFSIDSDQLLALGRHLSGISADPDRH